MFSFLKNKKININSISFPTFDWEVMKEDDYFKQWINKEQTVALSINFFDSKPDLPYLNEIDVVREFYRKELSADNGGLIEVNIKEIEDYKLLRAFTEKIIRKNGQIVKNIFNTPKQRKNFLAVLDNVADANNVSRKHDHNLFIQIITFIYE